MEIYTRIYGIYFVKKIPLSIRTKIKIGRKPSRLLPKFGIHSFLHGSLFYPLMDGRLKRINRLYKWQPCQHNLRLNKLGLKELNKEKRKQRKNAPTNLFCEGRNGRKHLSPVFHIVELKWSLFIKQKKKLCLNLLGKK